LILGPIRGSHIPRCHPLRVYTFSVHSPSPHLIRSFLHSSLCIPNPVISSPSSKVKALVSLRMSSERPYEESELKYAAVAFYCCFFFFCFAEDLSCGRHLTRPQLLALVRGQIERWPKTNRGRGLNEKRVTKSQLITTLLNPANHFTTTAPRAAAQPPALLGWTPSDTSSALPSSSPSGGLHAAVGAISVSDQSYRVCGMMRALAQGSHFQTFSVDPHQLLMPSNNNSNSASFNHSAQQQRVPERVTSLPEPLATAVVH
jgi:hypothetical protein